MTPDIIKENIDKLLKGAPLAGLSSEMKLILESQLRGLLNSANLVSREEFDIQAEALIRARKQLEQLEARVIALEQEDSAE